MSKVPPTLPGIPTDEEPLWQQIQRASRFINQWACTYEDGESEPHRQALLRAVREFKRLVKQQG